MLQENTRLESDLVYSQTYNNITLTLRGDISGPGSLTKTFDPNDRGTRLVLLGKNSTHSGGTIFKTGYLDVLGARSLGSGPVTMGGKASPEHVVAFANMAPMTGAKTLAVSGVNTATGPTRIGVGELAVLGPASLGSGSLEIADEAKIRLDYEGTRHIAALSVAGKALPRLRGDHAETPRGRRPSLSGCRRDPRGADDLHAADKSHPIGPGRCILFLMRESKPQVTGLPWKS